MHRTTFGRLLWQIYPRFATDKGGRISIFYCIFVQYFVYERSWKNYPDWVHFYGDETDHGYKNGNEAVEVNEQQQHGQKKPDKEVCFINGEIFVVYYHNDVLYML